MSLTQSWADLVLREKRALLDVVESFKDFEFEEGADEKPLPILIHHETQTRWVLIPGGNVRIGLSDKEESAARRLEDPPPLSLEEMRPCHQVDVGHLLVMQYPLTRRCAAQLINLDNSIERPTFGKNRDSDWIYLSREEVENIQKHTGWLLPTEYQWEYICRAGSQTLFFFGDELLPESALKHLVTHDVDDAEPNPAGLYGLFLGEWCRDHFRPTYDSQPTDAWVVRGGASAFWPWQDSEWAYCVSSMRMPSTDVFDELAGARFVIELG